MINTKIEGFRLRFAGEEDISLILAFIRELAEYEHLLDQVEATEEVLFYSLFIKKGAEVLIGEYRGEPICFALFFHNISTFTGRRGIFLEDLFVKPEYRGGGFGKAIMSYLAKLAVERGCSRVDWACLTWNEPSIGFYFSLGADTHDEWMSFRLDKQSLDTLAAKF